MKKTKEQKALDKKELAARKNAINMLNSFSKVIGKLAKRLDPDLASPLKVVDEYVKDQNKKLKPKSKKKKSKKKRVK